MIQRVKNGAHERKIGENDPKKGKKNGKKICEEEERINSNPWMRYIII